MSSSELVERYGFSGFVADHIRGDVDEAIIWKTRAVMSRMYSDRAAKTGADQAASMYRENERYALTLAKITMNYTRNIIALVVLDENLQAERDAQNGQAHFWQGACGHETCGDCERPLWHHIEHDSLGRLCPFGRRYWQLARAMVTEREYTKFEVHKSVLAELARRG